MAKRLPNSGKSSVPDFGYIADRLESVRAIAADGSIAFQGWEVREWQAVLEASYPFPDEISTSARPGVVWSAIVSAGKRGRITGRNLRSELARACSMYLGSSKRRLIVITTASIARDGWVPRRIPSKGGSIWLDCALPKMFRFDAVKRLIEQQRMVFHPDDYVRVRISVRARNAGEAVQQALERLDYLRGVWNFLLNRPTFQRITGSRQPINAIQLGPVHTVHEATGELASSSYWYEPQWIPLAPSNKVKEKWQWLRREEPTVRRWVNRSAYADVVRRLFVRYARALDGLAFDTSYIQLWSLLEALTGTQPGEGYDRTIRRALFCFDESIWHRQILEALRAHRNQVVHCGTAVEGIDALLFQLKRYVEVLLEFHLAQGARFHAFQEATEFLDLAPDVPELRRQIKSRQRAIRFRSPRKSK